MKTTKQKASLLACVFFAAMLFQNCKKDNNLSSKDGKELSSVTKTGSLPSVSSQYEVGTVVRNLYTTAPDRICTAGDGTMYYTSSSSNQIFKVTLGGDTSLMANLPNDGTGTRALRGLKAGESGTVYVVLIKTNKVVKIDRRKRITEIPVSIGLNQPNDLAIGPDSTLYIADTENRRIVKVTRNGTATVLAGKTGVSGSADGSGSNARFNKVLAIRYAADGTIWVLDNDSTDPFDNFATKLRKITLNGTVSTFFRPSDTDSKIADFAPAKRDKNFNATGPENFFLVKVKAIDDPLDLNTMISHVSNTGVETSLTPYSSLGFQDGSADQAQWGFVTGITVKPYGIYVADNYNAAVRVIRKKI